MVSEQSMAGQPRRIWGSMLALTKAPSKLPRVQKIQGSFKLEGSIPKRFRSCTKEVPGPSGQPRLGAVSILRALGKTRAEVLERLAMQCLYKRLQASLYSLPHSSMTPDSIGRFTAAASVHVLLAVNGHLQDY